jgi:hypothetical protein
MALYDVKLPIAGTITFFDIEADSEQAAIDAVFELDPKEAGADIEWDIHTKIASGNVLYAPLNKPVVTLLENED